MSDWGGADQDEDEELESEFNAIFDFSDVPYEKRKLAFIFAGAKVMPEKKTFTWNFESTKWMDTDNGYASTFSGKEFKKDENPGKLRPWREIKSEVVGPAEREKAPRQSSYESYKRHFG